MPIFEYECRVCGKIQELLRKSSEKWVRVGCPDCAGDMTKIVSRCGARFIGEGFYKPTDKGSDE